MKDRFDLTFDVIRAIIAVACLLGALYAFPWTAGTIYAVLGLLALYGEWQQRADYRRLRQPVLDHMARGVEYESEKIAKALGASHVAVLYTLRRLRAEGRVIRRELAAHQMTTDEIVIRMGRPKSLYQTKGEG